MRRVVAHRLGLLSYAKGQAAQRAGSEAEALLEVEGGHAPLGALEQLVEQHDDQRQGDRPIGKEQAKGRLNAAQGRRERGG